MLSRFPAGYRPLVVDNGSSDGSVGIANEFGVRVVHQDHRRGFGAASTTGVLAASTAIVCVMDCDGTVDPAELPRVIAPIESGAADFVIGARVCTRSTMRLHLRMANRALAGYLRRHHAICVADLGSCRAFRRDNFSVIQPGDDRNGWALETTVRARAAGLLIVDVPVRHLARRGKSKVTGTARGCIETTTDMLHVLWQARRW